MKIQHFKSRPPVRFDTLEPGDLFKFTDNDTTFLTVKKDAAAILNAVDLCQYTRFWVHDGTMVVRLESNALHVYGA